MNYAVLREEILTDPLGRGYAGMTDEQVAEDLNTAYRTIKQRIKLKDLVSYLLKNDLWFAIREAAADPTHTAHRAAVYALDLVDFAKADMLDDIDSDDATFRALFQQLISGGIMTSTQGQEILAMAYVTMTRAEELGLGVVKPGHVRKARGG